MNIDPVQILQVQLYSKFITDVVPQAMISNTNMVLFALCIIFYNTLQYDFIRKKVYDVYDSYVTHNESYIIIPYHTMRYKNLGYGGSKEIVRTIYSDTFHAINHYLENHMTQNIDKMVESTKNKPVGYYDDEKTDYMMVPAKKQKILLDAQRNIYFEITISEDNDENGEKDAKKDYGDKHPKYIYRIFKHGSGHYKELHEFLNHCVATYEKSKDDSNPKIYEYLKSEKDDYDNEKLVFQQYHFHSNKHLDKNVFLENRQEFINYIDKFSKYIEPVKKAQYDMEYENAGITYKSGMILHGPPGCGKSCTIRGILNRTGRIGVILRWGLFKTCSEFCALFRSGKINGKQYKLSDLCFIVEDFDANNDDVLKTRKGGISHFDLPIMEHSIDSIDTEPIDVKEELRKSHETIHALKQFMAKKDDELTLDCVLNVMDGIIELHGAMIIFTTNHLEKIDPAFTRPGRIDKIVHLRNASVQMIREMVTYKYGIDLHPYDHYFAQMTDYKISPATVQNVYMNYPTEKIERCLQELVDLCNQSSL